LTNLFTNQDYRNSIARTLKDMAENPGLENTHKFYEMEPDER
jgi:hypothetical protein